MAHIIGMVGFRSNTCGKCKKATPGQLPQRVGGRMEDRSAQRVAPAVPDSTEPAVRRRDTAARPSQRSGLSPRPWRGYEFTGQRICARCAPSHRILTSDVDLTYFVSNISDSS
jgi:hypothetical protein